MTIREQLELSERTYLSSYAMLSQDSRGRDREEPECDIRPVFQRDRGSDPALQIFQAAETQDAGISVTAGGSLPDTADPCAGSVTECENYCKGTAPE